MKPSVSHAFEFFYERNKGRNSRGRRNLKSAASEFHGANGLGCARNFHAQAIMKTLREREDLDFMFIKTTG